MTIVAVYGKNLEIWYGGLIKNTQSELNPR